MCRITLEQECEVKNIDLGATQSKSVHHVYHKILYIYDAENNNNVLIQCTVLQNSDLATYNSINYWFFNKNQI